MNVKQHRAAGVGFIGGVQRAAGQVPQQPAVHRTKQQFPAAGLVGGAGHMPQNPFGFAGGKIGVGYQACLLPDGLCLCRCKRFNPLSGTPALPDNRVVHRFAGGAFPHKGGFTLVGNANAGQLPGLYTGLRHGLAQYCQRCGPNFQRVLFHPARVGVKLGNLPLGGHTGTAVMVKQNTPRTGRALIQRGKILLHGNTSLGKF